MFDDHVNNLARIDDSIDDAVRRETWKDQRKLLWKTMDEIFEDEEPELTAAHDAKDTTSVWKIWCNVTQLAFQTLIEGDARIGTKKSNEKYRGRGFVEVRRAKPFSSAELVKSVA